MTAIDREARRRGGGRQSQGLFQRWHRHRRDVVMWRKLQTSLTNISEPPELPPIGTVIRADRDGCIFM